MSAAPYGPDDSSEWDETWEEAGWSRPDPEYDDDYGKDRCARCGGDCPMIDCRVCGGCEEVACPAHNTPRGAEDPELGPVWPG